MRLAALSRPHIQGLHTSSSELRFLLVFLFLGFFVNLWDFGRAGLHFLEGLDRAGSNGKSTSNCLVGGLASSCKFGSTGHSIGKLMRKMV
jgi:hypothetical protein